MIPPVVTTSSPLASASYAARTASAGIREPLRSRPGDSDENVLHVARRLLSIVQARPSGTVALVVTDGTGEEDDSGEEMPDDDLSEEDAKLILAALKNMKL